MKLRKSKGFTIIELVIVIAVIGILTAVLVPTFINLTAKANEAADQSLVKNLNTALKMEEQTAGHQKAPTLQGAIDDLKNQGFLLENIVAKSGQDLLWNQPKNEFVLNKENEYSGKDYWQIVNSMPSTNNQKYSYYAGKDFTATEVNPKYGFDGGENKTITLINYDRHDVAIGAKQEVSIRTNSQFTDVVIDAYTDTVHHYGAGNSLTITNVAGSSFHENGSWRKITLTNGNLEVSPTAFIGEIEKNGGKLNNKGTVVKAISGTAASTDVVNDGTIGVSESTVLKVGDADTLLNLAFAQSTNVFEGNKLDFELTDDIDLSTRTWIPFGLNKDNPYSGHIDGKGHTITGLSNNGFSGEEYTTSSTNITGDNFGFIADATGEVTVENLTFKDVKIEGTSNACGVVVGRTSYQKDNASERYYLATKINLSNVHVTGNSIIKGVDKVAGLVGYSLGYYNNNNDSDYQVSKLYIENCSVNATIYADQYRAGGFIGYIGNGAQVKVSNSSFSGSLSVGDVTNKGYNWTGALFGAFATYIKAPVTLTVSGFSTDANVQNATTRASNNQYLLKTSGDTVKSLGLIQYNSVYTSFPSGVTINRDSGDNIVDFTASNSFSIKANNLANPLD